MFYTIITWFTDCPYFNFLSSICGIFSALAIINFLYFRKPKFKTNPAEAQRVIDVLLKCASETTEIFIPMELPDFNSFPDLKGKKVDPYHSFCIRKHTNPLYFALVQTNMDLRLYACLDVLQSSFRLIATDKLNPDLKKLRVSASKINDLSDSDFLDSLLNELKKF